LHYTRFAKIFTSTFSAAFGGCEIMAKVFRGAAGVGKKKWQRRRFDMAGAKDHVGFASHGVAKDSSPR
jgi:hypothetical protein